MSNGMMSCVPCDGQVSEAMCPRVDVEALDKKSTLRDLQVPPTSGDRLYILIAKKKANCRYTRMPEWMWIRMCSSGQGQTRDGIHFLLRSPVSPG